MGIGRFIMGTTLAAGVGLAAYLVATQQDPRTWGQHVKHQVRETSDQITAIRQSTDRVSASTQQLTAAITVVEPVLADIQGAVDKFTFKIAPRVANIEEIVAKWDRN